MFKVKRMIQNGRKLREDRGQVESNSYNLRSCKRIVVMLFDKFKFIVNIKNNTPYTFLTDEVINATNAQDGQKMVLYTDDKNLYVREVGEFDVKFNEEIYLTKETCFNCSFSSDKCKNENSDKYNEFVEDIKECSIKGELDNSYIRKIKEYGDDSI